MAGHAAVVASRLARGSSFLSLNGCWLAVEEPLRSAAGASQDRDHVILQAGVTDSVLDGLGDPTQLVTLAPVGSVQPPNTPLAGVSWEGMSQTAADELYHTVWGEVQGQWQLRLPFAASLLACNPELQHDPGRLLHPDESYWVVRVRALRRDYLQALSSAAASTH